MKVYINILMLCLVFTVHAQTANANYTISFEGTWSASTHPHANFSVNAHWSNLVGAMHNSNVVFVNPGSLASAGIEDVAENGQNDAIQLEVQNAMNAGNANLFFNQPFDAFSPTATAATSIVADQNFPLLSLASMIAPSPDWMIQVNSISLLDTNGDWIPSIVMDLFPYDAGTEDGNMYASNNPDTVPQQPISSLQNIAPFSNAKVGTLTISLVSLSTTEFNINTAFSVSTNAANKSIQIYNADRKTMQQIEMYDAFGNLLKRYANPSNEAMKTFTFPNTKSGLYIVKITTDTSTVIKKVLL
ncbi:spondin_N [Kordia sp. SMS9]|uniref:spondin domain-containing protein n=1 Tax=Kordia sp. SMS9 TaxID=2282170 RepID=UPI000E103214|nr:spondin domain-containing protein [Kordia sp. SMS9]AXG71567.1 spondin_N [Kordia sp. SMS9]